jgi:hypothetical protein
MNCMLTPRRVAAQSLATYGRRVWIALERTAWGLGIGCISGAAVMYVVGAAGARRELARFAVLRAASALQAGQPDSTGSYEQSAVYGEPYPAW